MQIKAGALLTWQRGLSASPTPSNDALDHLRADKARYRIVLDADFD